MNKIDDRLFTKTYDEYERTETIIELKHIEIYYELYCKWLGTLEYISKPDGQYFLLILKLDYGSILSYRRRIDNLKMQIIADNNNYECNCKPLPLPSYCDCYHDVYQSGASVEVNISKEILSEFCNAKVLKIRLKNEFHAIEAENLEDLQFSARVFYNGIIDENAYVNEKKKAIREYEELQERFRKEKDAECEARHKKEEENKYTRTFWRWLIIVVLLLLLIYIFFLQ